MFWKKNIDINVLLFKPMYWLVKYSVWKIKVVPAPFQLVFRGWLHGSGF